MSRREYREVAVIGRGAYGTVFKAEDVENNRTVALKRVRIVNTSDDKGVPVSTLREITLLKQLDNVSHPNIVRMFDAFQNYSTSSSDSPSDLILTIVFEHVEQDLSTFLRNVPSTGLSEDVVRDLMFQLLSGIDYLHVNRLVHRDIKPQNILITKHRQVKIADFGLARIYGFCKAMTSLVVTLWYRAPEILLQAPYATAVDLWSAGTIMAEIYNRRAIFPGRSDVDQLHKILSIIGTPPKNEWPENVSLPWENFKSYTPINIGHLVPDMCPEAVSLIQKLLVFNSLERVTAKDALQHPYFNDLETSDSQDSGVFSSSSQGRPLATLSRFTARSRSFRSSSAFTSRNVAQGGSQGSSFGSSQSSSQGSSQSSLESSQVSSLGNEENPQSDLSNYAKLLETITNLSPRQTLSPASTSYLKASEIPRVDSGVDDLLAPSPRKDATQTRFVQVHTIPTPSSQDSQNLSRADSGISNSPPNICGDPESWFVEADDTEVCHPKPDEIDEVYISKHDRSPKDGALPKDLETCLPKPSDLCASKYVETPRSSVCSDEQEQRTALSSLSFFASKHSLGGSTSSRTSTTQSTSSSVEQSLEPPQKRAKIVAEDSEADT